MQLSTNEIIILLQILTFIVAVILLYHLIFAVVTLRKILKRFDTVTKQIEEVVLKPISMADATVDWVVDFVEGYQKKGNQNKKVAAKKKSSKKKTTK